MSFFFLGGGGGNMSSRIPLSPLLVSKKEKEKDSNNIQFKKKKKKIEFYFKNKENKRICNLTVTFFKILILSSIYMCVYGVVHIYKAFIKSKFNKPIFIFHILEQIKKETID
jgi:hypothetical protein